MRGIYDTGSATFRHLFDVAARQHADDLASLFPQQRHRLRYH